MSDVRRPYRDDCAGYQSQDVAAAPRISDPRASLLHLGGTPWARIGELVGHGDIVTTARTYTHVVADEAELDYETMLR